jgi:hypothetical protein
MRILQQKQKLLALYCGELDMRLDPDEFHVDEMYRFDCNSIHDETAVLYAISDPASGVKGVLVDSSGADSCSLNFGIVQKLNLAFDVPFQYLRILPNFYYET